MRKIILKKSLLVMLCLTSCGGNKNNEVRPVTTSSVSLNKKLAKNPYSHNKYDEDNEYNPNLLNKNITNSLGQVGAGGAYEYLESIGKPIAGDEITVAVVDSGVDVGHFELEGQISEKSHQDSNRDDVIGHGTAVAGVIAAKRGNKYVHGIAFNAKIASVAMKGLGDGKGNTVQYGVSKNNLAQAVIDTGASIVNNSWGGGNADQYIEDLVKNDKKRLVIFASGNSASSNPSYTVRNIDNYQTFNNQVLTIGSVDHYNNIASYSDRCGKIKRCLVAAGGDYGEGFDKGGRMMAVLKPGNDFKYAQGTSFAAPLVSGAAAILKSAWNNLDAEQIADILIDTATDLGAEGHDEIYGAGLLNIYEAVQAQGDKSLGISSTTSYDLDSSILIVPNNLQALANSAGLDNILSQAVFFDKYGRDYQANLGDSITVVSNHSDFSNNFDAQAQSSSTSINFASLNLQFSTYEESDNERLSHFYSPEKKSKKQFLLGNVSYEFTNKNSNNHFNFSKSSYLPKTENSNFFDGIETKTVQNRNNFYEQNGSFDFYNFEHKYDFSDNFKLHNNFVHAVSTYSKAKLNGFSTSLDVDFNYLNISSTVSLYKEDDSFAGIAGEGAFDLAESSRNNALEVNLSTKLNKKFNFLFAAKLSKIKPNYKSELISGDKKFKTSTYTLAATYDYNKDNKFAFVYSKPWTINQGSLDITVPVGIDENNNIITKTATVDFASFDHNDFEFVWNKQISKKSSLKFNSVYKKYSYKEDFSAKKPDDFELHLKFTKKF